MEPIKPGDTARVFEFFMEVEQTETTKLGTKIHGWVNVGEGKKVYVIVPEVVCGKWDGVKDSEANIA